MREARGLKKTVILRLALVLAALGLAAGLAALLVSCAGAPVAPRLSGPQAAASPVQRKVATIRPRIIEQCAACHESHILGWQAPNIPFTFEDRLEDWLHDDDNYMETRERIQPDADTEIRMPPPDAPYPPLTDRQRAALENYLESVNDGARTPDRDLR